MIPLQDINTLAAAARTVALWIVAVCGGITGIAAAVAVIRKPWKRMQDEIQILRKEVADLKSQHEKDQHSNDERLANDLKLLNEVSDMVKYMHYGMMVLLDHAATGNSVERCKEARDRLEKHSSGI